MNNDLQHLHSTGRLRLIYSSDLGGLRDPVSARAALKRHPDEFEVLFEEMRTAVEKERRTTVKREQKRIRKNTEQLAIK